MTQKKNKDDSVGRKENQSKVTDLKKEATSEKEEMLIKIEHHVESVISCTAIQAIRTGFNVKMQDARNGIITNVRD